MELNGPVPFSDPSEAAINRQVDVELAGSSELHVDINQLYDIEECRDWIKHNHFSKVALQFPDDFLPDSASVAEKLKDASPDTRVYVLADTSYGSCCVDEVAAEHVNADAVIHFGRACLSPTSRLPVKYIFGKRPVDIAKACQQLTTVHTDLQAPLLVITDTIYSHAQGIRKSFSSTDLQDKLETTLRDAKYNVVSCSLDLPGNREARARETNTDSETLPGRIYHFRKDTERGDTTIFYVGPPSSTNTTLLMTHYSKFKSIHTFDPITEQITSDSPSTSRRLRRRYVAVQKVRDAGIIGVVVGTLGVSNYLELIRTLKARILEAGKKPYMLAMGKINPAKLANFGEIDVFVHVSCGENSLVENSGEFFKPIVTPYELTLGLSDQNGIWTNDWVTDFQKVLNLTDSDPVDAAKESDEQDEPRFSLIHGRFITTNRPMRAHREVSLAEDDFQQENDNSDLQTRGNRSLVASDQVFSPAAQKLHSKTWQGLENPTDDESPATLETGRHGIARGYQNER